MNKYSFLYLLINLSSHIGLRTIHKSFLLNKKPPTHVAAVEVLQLNKVIMDVDKAENDSTDNTETKDKHNYVDFLLYRIISEKKW